MLDVVSTKEGREAIADAIKGAIDNPSEAAENLVKGAIKGKIDDIKDTISHAKKAGEAIADNDPVRATWHSAYLTGKHGPDLALAAMVRVVKSKSTIWKNKKSYRKGTKSNGLTGKKREYYEWDHTHGDIEVYNSKGIHKGTMDPTSGEMIKPPVNGRKIKL